MSEQKPEEWLPVGWTVELKVRKDGKKDKSYIAPLSGLKFRSKAEVSQYLNTVQMNHTKSEQKKKGTRKRSAGDVVVERVIAEGLPPGWIKEIRVQKKAHTIRRDPYYTDPVSRYVFRSMKDVLRYLKTGELGRLAIKPKDIGSSDVELEDAKVSSPAITVEQNLVGSGTMRQIINCQSLNSNEMIKDEQVLNSVSTGECTLLSQHTSDRSGEATELSSSLNLPEAKGLEQIEGKSDCGKIDFALAPAVGTLQETKPSENGVVTRANRKSQLGQRGSKGKRESSMPLRSSKRLKGLEVDPTPELKTSSRAHRVVGKQLGEAEASTSEQEAKCTDHTSRSTEVLESSNSKIPFADLATTEDSSQKVEKENEVDEKQGIAPVLPFENLATLEKHTAKIEMENMADATPTCASALPLENLATPDNHVANIEMEDKADEKPGSSLDLPFGDSWPDPCIEFAVKTLTGAIPVGDDLDIQDYFQQLSSSTQADGGLTSLNIGSDTFCQTDFLCQQFNSVEKPAFKQQALVEDRLLPPGNAGLANSGETGLYQHGKEKR